jgi:hypothetical protein
MHAVSCGNTTGHKCHAKGAEKKLKYKSLCTEIQQMWNMKCMIITVTNGATRVVTKGLKKNLVMIPGKHSIDSLQIMAMLGMLHITWRILQSET